MAARLTFLAPEWNRSCDDCRRWAYDEPGQPITRNGRRIPLPTTAKPPCYKCVKVPEDVRKEKGHACTPADAMDPEDMHWWALQTFMECEAIRSFPDDDGWVRHDAALIRAVKDIADRQPMTTAMKLMALSLKKR